MTSTLVSFAIIISLRLGVASGAACDENKGNRYMGDSSRIADDLAACEQSCKDRLMCQSFTFYKSSGWCSHFIDRCDDTKPDTNAVTKRLSAILGLGNNGPFGAAYGKVCDKTQEEKQVDWKEDFTKDIAECKKSCEDEPRCQSITFYKDGWCSHFITKCQKMKDDRNAISMQIRDFTTAKPISKRDCYNFEKRHYLAQSSGKVADIAACRKSCEDQPYCQSITFFGNRWCSHFMTPCGITAFIGYGESSLMSKSNIFVGQECDADAGEKHLRAITAISFGACKKACDDEAECKSITFFKNKGCHLFSTSCAKSKTNIEADSMRVKGWAPNSKPELQAAIHACMHAKDFACSKGPKGPIGSWDVSRVTDFYELFYHNKYLTRPFNGDISKWDVSRVTNMRVCFQYLFHFNSDISKWDVSRVTNMEHMFYYAESFNADISKWDVSKVKHMRNMFHAARSFNRDISKWDVSNVKEMQGMFGNTDSFNQVLCGEWKKNTQAKKDSMFFNSPGKLC